jgi:hypothetical protein
MNNERSTLFNGKLIEETEEFFVLQDEETQRILTIKKNGVYKKRPDGKIVVSS